MKKPRKTRQTYEKQTHRHTLTLAHTLSVTLPTLAGISTPPVRTALTLFASPLAGIAATPLLGQLGANKRSKQNKMAKKKRKLQNRKWQNTLAHTHTDSHTKDARQKQNTIKNKSKTTNKIEVVKNTTHTHTHRSVGRE